MIHLPASRLGVLLTVSGPSGSGKTTLCRRLCDEGEAIFSVSCTTRPPRNYEEHGRDYYFLSEDEFLARVEQGDFFEYARVHNHFYGTPKSYITDHLLRGQDVLLDIDVQGAAEVRACADDLVQRCFTDIFILPPSVEELEKRLAGRGSESAERLALRLKNALDEMQHWPVYQHVLVSGAHEDDYSRFRSLLFAERMRSRRQRAEH